MLLAAGVLRMCHTCQRHTECKQAQRSAYLATEGSTFRYYCTARVYCTSFVGNEFKNMVKLKQLNHIHKLCFRPLRPTGAPTWFCTARVYCTSFVGNEFKNMSLMICGRTVFGSMVFVPLRPTEAPTWFGE